MIELRPLTHLDPATVQAAIAETVQRVTEDNPNLDVRRGVFAELLVYYHAVLDTQRRQNIADYLAGRSLLAITADPVAADPDLVDAVLSNFRLARTPGQVAAGNVTVVVADDVTVTIGQGSVWEARGQRYVTPRVFSAKVEAAQVTAATDRLLTKTADGNWAFTISVVAEQAGTEFNVKRGTLVAPLVVPPRYVTSFATADFTAGRNVETNQELLNRLQQGVAARTLSNRVNMAAMLRATEPFSRVVAMSIVGHGDAELARAFHSVLPVALGGRCDWYVRTQEAVVAATLTLSATLVRKNADLTGVWQAGVGRDAVPGFYEFRDVRPLGVGPAQGGYAVTEDVRGLDMTGPGVLPDVVTAVEAAYSAYATAVISFLDTSDHSLVAVGTVRAYQAGVVSLPLIGDIQALVASRDVRPYGGDCLIKAPVPCFVSLRFTINKVTGQADPDVAAMAAAVCHAVNTVGFVGALYGSQIQDVIYGYLRDGQTSSAVDMLGRVRYPAGTTRYLRSPDILAVPDDPTNMVTAKTVQFFAAPEDVVVTVVSRLPTSL